MSGLIKSIRERDPARPTFFEVVLAYPGVHALFFYRISHFFSGAGLKAVARLTAHIGRVLTGIEIHPGAKIGKRLFIDHGMGVVIGETAELGDDITLYHGVTLGGKGADEPGSKRHPTLEDGVMVGSNAQILGAITIGKDARIGAGSLVTKSVPAGCTAVGNPARIVNCKNEQAAYGLPDREELDPVGETISGMLKDIEAIKQKLDIEETKSGGGASEQDSDYAALWERSGI